MGQQTLEHKAFLSVIDWLYARRDEPLSEEILKKASEFLSEAKKQIGGTKKLSPGFFYGGTEDVLRNFGCVYHPSNTQMRFILVDVEKILRIPVIGPDILLQAING